MKLDNKWKNRKQREIRFFKNLSVITQDQLDCLPPSSQVKIREASNAQHRMKAHYSESNFGRFELPVRFSKYRLFYGYQRINLFYDKPLETQPYFKLKLNKNVYPYFSFTNCGQSAISVGILAAKKVYETDLIYKLGEIYYETFDFLEDLGIRFKNIDLKDSPRNRKILLIDSTSFQFNPFKIPKCKCAIIDTTCWSLGSPIISRLVEKIVKEGGDVLLVRSHIKLDCLGTEWNRLGSLFFISSHSKDRLEKFRSAFVKMANPFGARAEIRQIYPFLQSGKFQKLNEAWIEQLKSNNSFLTSELKKAFAKKSDFRNSKLEIRSFAHSLFFWVAIPECSIEINEKKSDKLVVALNSAGIPAVSIASYPWDFFSVTTFTAKTQNLNDRPRKFGAVRISAPDIPFNFLKMAFRIIEKWIEQEFL